MTEALLFISIGSLLTVGAVSLFTAARTSRDARRTVELAEACMNYIREERARLRAFSRENERRTFEGTLDPEYHPEAQRRAGWPSQEHELPRRERRRLTEELERERNSRREAERRITRLERELREARRESEPTVPVGPLENLSKDRGPSGESPLPAQEARKTGETPRPASFLETTAREPAGHPPEGKKRPRQRGVWYPHPDDGPVKEPVEQTRSNAPIKMFRKHYDKYLENYRGYVDLVEGLYAMRDASEVPPGSPGEREWEKRLRRVNDGIKRTTARLDLLEEHNPELATDDRVSHRASLARRHSELERSKRNREES